MTRPFDTNCFYDLKLHQRLTDQEGRQICHYLSKHAPADDRRYFDADMSQNVQGVFRWINDRMVSIALVADAIDFGAGKKTIADQVRALGAGPKMFAEEFLNKAGRIALIETHVLSDGEFVRFCEALSIPPSIYMRMQHDRVSRGYFALRAWFNMKIQTTDDLVHALSKFAPALISEIGLSAPSTAVVVQDSTPTPPQMSVDSSNPFASGFETATHTITTSTFIRDTDNAFLQKICTAINESDTYAQLLQIFGVQPSTASSQRLAQLREQWLGGRLTGKRGNPALTILTDLCASAKFASQPLDELAAKLMKSSSADVQTAVASWIAATADQKQELDGEIKASVDQHVELREFFAKHKLAANELEIQQCIDRLTTIDIDVHNVEHMRHMSAEDFRVAGFSLRLSKSIAAAVEKQFGSNGTTSRNE